MAEITDLLTKNTEESEENVVKTVKVCIFLNIFWKACQGNVVGDRPEHRLSKWVHYTVRGGPAHWNSGHVHAV